MNIQRFMKEKAAKSHGGTILASDVLPTGMKAPFKHAWGYLENQSQMEGHSHPTAEIYIVIQGKGIVVIGDERQDVGVGDVIEIPPNNYHTMICEDLGPFLWAALWWDESENA